MIFFFYSDLKERGNDRFLRITLWLKRALVPLVWDELQIHLQSQLTSFLNCGRVKYPASKNWLLLKYPVWNFTPVKTTKYLVTRYIMRVICLLAHHQIHRIRETYCKGFKLLPTKIWKFQCWSLLSVEENFFFLFNLYQGYQWREKDLTFLSKRKKFLKKRPDLKN